MNFNQETLNELFPFSFLVDQEGCILGSGRSLKKMCPESIEGRRLLEVFQLWLHDQRQNGGTPASYVGDLLILENKMTPGVRLRGQVVRLDPESKHFIFSLYPSFSDLKQIAAMGFDFSDFTLGDPVFDFLMMSQAQKIAQKKTEEALSRLDWENRASQLLYRILIDTLHLENAIPAFEIVLQRLREEFDPISCSYRLAGDPAVLDRGMDDSQVALTQGAGGISIEMPVRVSGQIFALVTVQFKESIQNRESLIRFFNLLSIQLSILIERQLASSREKEHMASLLTASKFATLGEISAGVAHEINNPLAAISAVGQTLDRALKKNAINEEQLRVQVDRINRCVARIHKIVVGLRDFSRESSKDPFAEVGLKSLIEETLDLCAARFREHAVGLRVLDVPEQLTFECRGSQISQVLLNLLNNAFDAVFESESPWVRIEVKDSDARLQIAVVDSGSGIPHEIADKLMHPFFTTKAPGKGTGLGLSISAGILQDHHGSLTLDQNSKNTRFLIDLPKRQR